MQDYSGFLQIRSHIYGVTSSPTEHIIVKSHNCFANQTNLIISKHIINHSTCLNKKCTTHAQGGFPSLVCTYKVMWTSCKDVVLEKYITIVGLANSKSSLLCRPLLGWCRSKVTIYLIKNV